MLIFEKLKGPKVITSKKLKDQNGSTKYTRDYFELTIKDKRPFLSFPLLISFEFSSHMLNKIPQLILLINTLLISHS